MVEAETHCSTHSPAHPWCCNWQECQLIFFQGFDVPVGCQEQNLLARCSSQQWKKLFQDSADQPKKKRKLMEKNGIVHLTLVTTKSIAGCLAKGPPEVILQSCLIRIIWNQLSCTSGMQALQTCRPKNGPKAMMTQTKSSWR